MIVTAKAGVFLIGLGMADQTGHGLRAAVIQLENVLAEQGGFPGGGGMAILTGRAHEARMYGWIFVAGNAGRRRVDKLFLGMAVFALGVGVLALQGIGLRMIELGNPVDAVVTGHAGLAIFVQMRLHKVGIVLGVARLACLRVGVLHVDRMAALAGERLIVVVARVMGQGELDRIQRSMRKRFAVEGGRRPGRGGVAGVTFLGKRILVNFWLGMAFGTSARGVLQVVRYVAFCAGEAGMLV